MLQFIMNDYSSGKSYKMDIIKTKDNYYRFIDCKNYLLSTGFKSRSKLIEYKDCIRIDKNTIKTMNKRYYNTKGLY